jgi:hypothetical protein
MARGTGRGDDEHMGDKLQAPPDFNGPTSDRHCRDVLCTILIVAMWISMTVLGPQAIAGGDFVILYPLDYESEGLWNEFCARYDRVSLFLVHQLLGRRCVCEGVSQFGGTDNEIT